MKYGLIGERLGHSFSKIIHKKIADYGYELCEIPRDGLSDFISGRDFLGINVTIPYKESVIPLLDEIDEPAKRIGAVNTVVNKNGRLCGYNTDFYGMSDLISHAGIEVLGRKAAILGSGGTSKTARAVLSSLGASEILTVSRSKRGGAISYEELAKLHSDIEILVNTTPVGMYPDILACPVDLSNFSDLAGVIDPIYNPINTTLIQRAREMGIKAEGGLYMLVSQAVRSAELFLDTELPSSLTDQIYREIKREKESIVLIGMPGSGKSTVGGILAEKLSRRLVDTDEIIKKRIGMEIKDFFALHGEDSFREIESEVIKKHADQSSLVISTGGGAILRKENISALKYNGKIFFIDRPIHMIVATESRPLSSDREALQRRYDERYGIYIGACDYHIDGSPDANAVCEKIMENF